ncbi:hypothetical protein apy_14570 [Aeropyrum pernix]|uniref:Uncharacterized protein n=1 Tax=Aeropyrum pernix TaxID=56636 RepID=A0A401HBI9_AERPX|nr:hypothetical protein [Aeropyrum pernix]GBF09732.1 hypothetical protein apy_14570 [Aeropyrum pernix]
MERSPEGATSTKFSNNLIESLALQLLKPNRISPETALRALKKARRTGALWRVLSPLERGLLEAAARVRLNEFRAEKLRSTLALIIAKIELHTFKGTLIILGLSRLLTLKSTTPLEFLRGRLSYIIYLGRIMLETINYFKPWTT